MTPKAPARLATLLAVALAAPAQAAGPRPVVVELFTSQGCSSCPPADANLIEVMRRPNVLALSFAVTYWDRLGWKDVFGKPAFTARQYAYEPALGEPGPFTPQIVVDGRVSAVGMRRGEIEALVAAARPVDGPTVDLAAARVAIGRGAAPKGGADVWLVRYEPGIVEVAVARGENAGRRLSLGHVVRDLTRLGDWSGAAIDHPLPPAPAGLRTAVLVQAAKGGPILAATTD